MFLHNWTQKKKHRFYEKKITLRGKYLRYGLDF